MLSRLFLFEGTHSYCWFLYDTSHAMWSIIYCQTTLYIWWIGLYTQVWDYWNYWRFINVERPVLNLKKRHFLGFGSAFACAVLIGLMYLVLRKVGSDIHYTVMSFYYSLVGVISLGAIVLMTSGFSVPCQVIQSRSISIQPSSWTIDSKRFRLYRLDRFRLA